MSDSRGIEVNWPVIRVLVGLVFLLPGFALLGISIYAFMRVGEWGAPSLVDVATAFGIAKTFFSEWAGIAKILDFIPAWLALLVVGYWIVISD